MDKNSHAVTVRNIKSTCEVSPCKGPYELRKKDLQIMALGPDVVSTVKQRKTKMVQKISEMEESKEQQQPTPVLKVPSPQEGIVKRSRPSFAQCLQNLSLSSRYLGDESKDHSKVQAGKPKENLLKLALKKDSAIKRASFLNGEWIRRLRQNPKTVSPVKESEPIRSTRKRRSDEIVTEIFKDVN